MNETNNKLDSSKIQNILTDCAKLEPPNEEEKLRWLSTVNINEAMSDIEQKSNNFKFLGTVPIDFYTMDCLKINKINYKELINDNIHKIGIIINTDPSYRPGKLWVAMFTDFDKGLIFYYDIMRVKPSVEIKNFIKLHKQFMEEELGMDNIVIKYNEIDCENFSNGMQCILFLKNLALQ